MCDHINKNVELCQTCSAPINCQACGSKIKYNFASYAWDEKFKLLNLFDESLKTREKELEEDKRKIFDLLEKGLPPLKEIREFIKKFKPKKEETESGKLTTG